MSCVKVNASDNEYEHIFGKQKKKPLAESAGNT